MKEMGNGVVGKGGKIVLQFLCQVLLLFPYAHQPSLPATIVMY
jgi:hypothetical protein